MIKVNVYRYKIVLRTCWFLDPIDYAFFATDDADAMRQLDECANIYSILKIMRYNKDTRKYVSIPSLEAKYVKAN